MSNQKDKRGYPPRRATAQTVADLAGVSRSAVSRAFTPGAYVDSEKRRRILKIAADAGYQPNALAAGLKAGQSNLVAVFVGNMRSPYDSAFVGELAQALSNLKKWPILIDGTGARTDQALRELLRYPLDALILRGGSMSEAIVDKCSRFGIPMISSGRPVQGPRVDNVCCRNADGMHMITNLLVNRGRRRFGFLSGPEEFYSSSRRRAGVLDALNKAGLELVAERPSDYSVESGYDAARSLLSRNRLDAVICANDATAIGALSAARELSLNVPDDLAIVGFDDIAMAKWPTFNLTTVRNPIDAAVDAIVELLERRLIDPSRTEECIFLDPLIIERGTH